MNDHERFMGLAIEEALRAYGLGEVPVGALVVDERGGVLSLAHNSPILMSDPSAHAEILALRKACRLVGNYRLPGKTLYVTLEPCAMCLGGMLHARIDTLVFGACDPKSGAAGGVVDLTRVPAFNHNLKVVAGVRADECAELLKRFFRERRQAAKDSKDGEVPKWP